MVRWRALRRRSKHLTHHIRSRLMLGRDQMPPIIAPRSPGNYGSDLHSSPVRAAPWPAGDISFTPRQRKCSALLVCWEGGYDELLKVIAPTRSMNRVRNAINSGEITPRLGDRARRHMAANTRKPQRSTGSACWALTK